MQLAAGKGGVKPDRNTAAHPGTQVQVSQEAHTQPMQAHRVANSTGRCAVALHAVAGAVPTCAISHNIAALSEYMRSLACWPIGNDTQKKYI